MKKVSTHEKDITIMNTYASNHRNPKYIEQKLRQLKGKIDNSTIIFEDLNTFLSVMDRITKKMLNLKKVEGI